MTESGNNLLNDQAKLLENLEAEVSKLNELSSKFKPFSLRMC